MLFSEGVELRIKVIQQTNLVVQETHSGLAAEVAAGAGLAKQLS